MNDEDLWNLLKRLQQMPDDTDINIRGFSCCAHELRAVATTAWFARNREPDLAWAAKETAP
jgi:hypothetical protein